MSQNPETEGWRKILADNGRKVEERLGAAQSAHRLVIHCFENRDASRVYPADTLGDISKNIRIFANTPPGDLNDNPALLSVSLLPSTETGKHLMPYSMGQYGETIGYLFDIDEKKPNPARVAHVFTGTSFTNNCNFSKLDSITGELEAFGRLEHISAHLSRPSVSRKSLFINNFMNHPQDYVRKLGDLIAGFHKSDASEKLNWNEVLVAVTPQHISAIAVPLSSSLNMNNGLGTAHAKLRGALAGLAHLDKDMDLPVVSYDATQEGSGRIRYLAQGKEQLQALAMESIRDLQANPAFLKQAKGPLINVFKSVHSAAENYLGVDIYKPLREQNIELASQDRGA